MARLFCNVGGAALGEGDAYQQFVVEQFGDPEAILVLDETGFLKKGAHSVGVQRRSSGTAGKVENCQVGVFLAYVTDRRHLLLDRRLDLPDVWAGDPARRATAKVPEAVSFQTTRQLGLALLEQVWAAGVPHASVATENGAVEDARLHLGMAIAHLAEPRDWTTGDIELVEEKGPYFHRRVHVTFDTEVLAVYEDEEICWVCGEEAFTKKTKELRNRDEDE